MAQKSSQKVILLRSPVDSDVNGQDEYSRLLQDAGYTVCLVPTLAFEYQNLDSLASLLASPSSFSGLIFTSPRAVTAASDASRGQKLASAWKDKPCFVVGARTCSLVKERLGLSGSASDSGNAENLAEEIITQMAGEDRPLLFPAGNLKKETLPTMLRNSGIPFNCCTVYATSQHPDMISELKKCLQMKPDYIVYFSPSGVNFSQPALGGTEGVKHVSIGPTTKAALEKCGIQVFGCAQKPCPESLLEIFQGSR